MGLQFKFQSAKQKLRERTRKKSIAEEHRKLEQETEKFESELGRLKGKKRAQDERLRIKEERKRMKEELKQHRRLVSRTGKLNLKYGTRLHNARISAQSHGKEIGTNPKLRAGLSSAGRQSKSQSKKLGKELFRRIYE